ncbi:MAG: hypothetical protein IT573_06480 [Deltaproteobacteria bacterium]|nr:hypothetical protein [Deltaproteobacteria bacterium]
MTPILPSTRDANGCWRAPSDEISPAFLLSRILTGNEEGLSVSGAAAASDLRRALNALPATQRSRLQSEAAGHLESLLSLAQEREPGTFFAGLMDVARALETQERYEMAGLIYMTVVAFNRAPGCAPVRRDLAQRAQARLDFLSGRGTWRDYGELFLRQTVDPSDLVAFGVAGVVGRTVRFAALSRILRTRTRFAAAGLPAPWVSREPVSRLVAGWAGVTMEAPAFAMASRASQTLQGRDLDWSSDALDRDLRNAYLLFVPTRAMMSAGSLLARRRMGLASMRGATLRQRLAHEGAVQVGILGGLYLAHLAQTSRGGPHDSPSSFESLSDGARLYLQFNALRGPAALFLRPRRLPGG